MLAVEVDELASDALKLGRSHRGRGQLDCLLYVGHCDFPSSFARMVLLVSHDLGEDVGRGLVELIEVVLLRRRFLLHC